MEAQAIAAMQAQKDNTFDINEKQKVSDHQEVEAVNVDDSAIQIEKVVQGSKPKSASKSQKSQKKASVSSKFTFTKPTGKYIFKDLKPFDEASSNQYELHSFYPTDESRIPSTEILTNRNIVKMTPQQTPAGDKPEVPSGEEPKPAVSSNPTAS